MSGKREIRNTIKTLTVECLVIEWEVHDGNWGPAVAASGLIVRDMSTGERQDGK